MTGHAAASVTYVVQFRVDEDSPWHDLRASDVPERHATFDRALTHAQHLAATRDRHNPDSTVRYRVASLTVTPFVHVGRPPRCPRCTAPLDPAPTEVIERVPDAMTWCRVCGWPEAASEPEVITGLFRYPEPRPVQARPLHCSHPTWPQCPCPPLLLAPDAAEPSSTPRSGSRDTDTQESNP